MTLLLLPVIAIAAVVALAMSVPGSQVARWAGIAVAGAVGLTLLEVVLFVGLRGAGDDASGDDSPAGSGATGPATTTPATTTQATTSSPVGVRTVDAVMVAPDPDAAFPPPTRPVDDLGDGDLLFVEAQLAVDGEIRQCPEGALQATACGMALPVPAPRDEVARFLVPVVDAVATPTGTVDCRTQTCTLVLFTADEHHAVATLPLLFGRPATDPSVELLDDGPFAHGDTVGVHLRDFPPGEEVVVTQCTPPGPSDRSRCGAPAPEVSAVVGVDGAVTVPFRVHLGSVGAAAQECRRAEPCAIGVVDSPVTAAVVPIGLAGTPGSDVPDSRVAWAFVVAALCAAVAITLVVRGDWDDPDGDPFAGVRLTVPEGWEDLRAGSTRQNRG